MKPKITVEKIINASVENVWQIWTDPVHIKKWNNASEDWHTPFAENDLQVGGKFISRMEAKGGSQGFDFEGVYNVVIKNEYLEYSISDGRKVKVFILSRDKETKIVEIFEAESIHSIELQQKGWQAILDNFKKYTELITN